MHGAGSSFLTFVLNKVWPTGTKAITGCGNGRFPHSQVGTLQPEVI